MQSRPISASLVAWRCALRAEKRRRGKCLPDLCRACEAESVTDEVGDQESADMMIERMQVHAKAAWTLRAHLEG